jgi:hypothetical protein
VEEQAIIRMCILHEPLHRIEDVLPRRPTSLILMVFREENRFVGMETVVLDKEATHIACVVYAAFQRVRGVFVVDSDLANGSVDIYDMASTS